MHKPKQEKNNKIKKEIHPYMMLAHYKKFVKQI